ncbi:MAG: hypothetical protein KGQ86_00760 [Bacteroidetes bacterium]|nr:hypothetical protein [Bacteroidota bacterium]
MKTIFLYLFLILPFILFSQDELYQSTRDDLNYGEFRPNNLAPRYGIAEKPGKLLGNIHLDTTFRKSAVVFFKDVVRRYDPDASDSISGYKMRINLLEKLVEFQIGDLVKGIDFRAIKKIQTFDLNGNVLKTFLHSSIEGPKNYLENGFFELIYAGRHIKVISIQILKKKEPTYHVALSVGDKNAYYYLKTSYFSKIDNGDWVETNLNKKAWLGLTGFHAKKMESYLKENRINMNNEEAIKSFCQFFDGLNYN